MSITTPNNVISSRLLDQSAITSVFDRNLTFTPGVSSAAVTMESTLDPHAAPYKPLESSLSKAGAVAQDLCQDWAELQQVSAGGMGSVQPVVNKWSDDCGSLCIIKTIRTSSEVKNSPNI